MQYNAMCLLTLAYIRISRDSILNDKKEKKCCVIDDTYVLCVYEKRMNFFLKTKIRFTKVL